jgi:hypothetical protein
MKANHLTDPEIQVYALTSEGTELPATKHLEQCDMCSLKVKNYQQILIGIKGQSKAEFDFNLSELVIAQVSPKRASSNATLFWVAGIISLLITGYLCGIYLSALFPGISPITFYLVFIPASALLIFQGTEIYQKYKKPFDTLDFY